MITIGNQIELRHIRYFLAVAEELHFGKASERLFISQPGLSRQIKQLESELGFALFYRNNRNVLLTTAGEYLQKEMKGILTEFEIVLNTTKLVNEGVVGNLNFGYVGSAMEQIIPELLVKIRVQYPEIHFSLKEMDNQKQLEMLQTQEIDIGFVRLERVPVGFKILPILEDTFSLVLPKNHDLNSSKFKDLSQLRNEQFIMFDPSYSQNYYQKIMEIFNFYGFTPNINHRTVHAASINKLVALNFGISIVPSSLKNDTNPNIKFVELKNIPFRTTLSAVWNKRNRNPVLAKLLKIMSDLKV